MLPEEPFEQSPAYGSTENEPKNPEDPGPENPVLDTFNQFLQKARQITICHTSKVFNLPGRSINAHFVTSNNYGRLICDNAVDTGSLAPLLYHPYKSTTSGCKWLPSTLMSYFLESGITAVDLPNGPVLLGQHEVPIIPESDIMLISETQARCFGIDIDSKSHCFGGRASIIFHDKTSIPLRLEHALMTCHIHLPTDEELQNLEVHWLTAIAPWDPLQ